MKLAVWRSDLLSAFEGRTVEMRAGVLLPPSYANSGERKYPTVYYVHGFGGSYVQMWLGGLDCCGHRRDEVLRGMAASNWPEMIYVYLDASCPMGHHEFADSVNNGPWARRWSRNSFPTWSRRFAWRARPAADCLRAILRAAGPRCGCR